MSKPRRSAAELERQVDHQMREFFGDAPLSRGLEVHPAGQSADLKVWIDRSIVPEGYGWIFPAGDELRIGVGSFDESRGELATERNVLVVDGHRLVFVHDRRAHSLRSLNDPIRQARPQFHSATFLNARALPSAWRVDISVLAACASRPCV